MEILNVLLSLRIQFLTHCQDRVTSNIYTYITIYNLKPLQETVYTVYLLMFSESRGAAGVRAASS